MFLKDLFHCLFSWELAFLDCITLNRDGFLELLDSKKKKNWGKTRLEFNKP